MKAKTRKIAPLYPMTADVFSRNDCPDWARFAAVDPDGLGWWFSTAPIVEVGQFGTYWTCDGESQACGWYDDSDWRSSAVVRNL